ncbi:ferritin-like domain-containing protein [Actinosynnema sp. ALI-1.44]|uniref:ferritin-like domain-containing protein n=1 Tax=Actinosynnema sp. ALI-1.44 TaxID=1933779 RepID=UPI00143D5ACC|nr:ferritin-like domain-containing protein [Actinosynnema sp. ALI-1.44]
MDATTWISTAEYHLFKGNRLVCINTAKNNTITYDGPITEHPTYKNLPTELTHGIDATTWITHTDYRLFKGNRLVRINTTNNRVDFDDLVSEYSTYKNLPPDWTEAPDPLVDLLHQAAQLEHCLLNSYLYAAASLKTLPEEFAVLPDGRENRRRAIQFERVRAWKQAILEVAHEEMIHLHYVQCLIRGLGATPYFGLPPRDPGSGNWVIGDWTAHLGSQPPAPTGTEVPVDRLTPANVRRFVLYESTDAMQDEDPFGSALTDLFSRLHDFELDFLLESLLVDVTDEGEHADLKEKLASLHTSLTPAEAKARAEPPLGAVDVGVSSAEVSFQSIADLYNEQIQPLYQQAFDQGRVADNLELVGEFSDQNYAAEGFLPTPPVHRDKNFDRQAKDDFGQPLYDVKHLNEIIAEIVEEGEGLAGFADGAEAFLAKVAELGGAKAYLTAVNNDAHSPDPTPDWLDQGQRLRMSHLYRFAITMIDLDHEIQLAATAGTEFDPARAPLPTGGHPEIAALADTLPAQFNAAYLALVTWLSRMYELRTWQSDRRNRMGIEMLASWPLMSLAIRPFLELAGFLPVDPRHLFNVTLDALPTDPPEVRELFELYTHSQDRSQDINDRMDVCALKTLSAVGAWAAAQQAATARVTGISPEALRAISLRLGSLANLGEFEKQFPYRAHGGYTDRPPDPAFLLANPDGDGRQYEEDGNQPELFTNTFVLRVRFAGRELIQLSTDPDPPTDEAGCSGTHMLHAADGDGHWLDRSVIWQPDLDHDTNVFGREPKQELPPLGVHVQQLDLFVTGDGPASSGYVPISEMSSSGAVQTQGVQQLAQITGLSHVDELRADSLRVSLLPQHGQKPYLNGDNHLIWQDGEPIDPFVLALCKDDGTVIWQREIHNDGKTLRQMSPLQRLQSLRGPCGFDSYRNVPDWALSSGERALLDDPRFPASYLEARAGVLTTALKESLKASTWDRSSVDAAISYAERLRLVASPRSTTFHWLPVILHYGHTVSGEMRTPGRRDVPAETSTGLQLAVVGAGRKNQNGRWFTTYTQGIMDTDALSALVFGELYIPLQVTRGGTPVAFTRRWTFPAGLADAVTSYAARFDVPFWAHYDVTGTKRTRVLSDGTTLVETLTSSNATSYTYKSSGVRDISNYVGTFSVESTDSEVTLTWDTTFTFNSQPSSVHMFSINATSAEAMTDSLGRHFSPR